MALEALQKVNQELGTTTAIITHNAGIAQMANRVIHLADGQSLLGITPLASQVLDARSRAQAEAKVSAAQAALQAAKAQVKSISAAEKLANDDVQRYTPPAQKRFDLTGYFRQG